MVKENLVLKIEFIVYNSDHHHCITFVFTLTVFFSLYFGMFFAVALFECVRSRVCPFPVGKLRMNERKEKGKKQAKF